MSGQTTLSGGLREGTGKNNTPLKWVRPIANAVGGFDLDPCASHDSDLADVNIRNSGGLQADWSEHEKVFCNHPYARGEPPKWLRKAAMSDCRIIITLSKGDPSADWFHDWIVPHAAVVCFPDERIQFVGEDNSAKFPNVFSVFGEAPTDLLDFFAASGWVVDPSGTPRPKEVGRP